MTPAERVADYREELELATIHRIKAITFRLRLEDIAKILALAEAVRDYLAECDSPVPDHTMRRRKREKLAAAWAALGDADHG